MRILAVDDDENFLVTLCDLLGSKGHDVDTATTGGEALLKIGRDAYDIILIDINLPDTSGVDLLRAIKNSRSPPECVMITAHQTTENAVRALNLGAEAYLTKPVEVPDLFDTIERIGEIRAAKLTETKRRQEAEEALRDAEQMALVGRVAAMMVHDLRGPLQTIRNSVFLFEMAPEKAEKARELIESAVDQTANMLDELRNSTEKSPLRRETVNLTSLIEKTVEEAYIPNTIELKIVGSEGLDAVNLDPSKFRRVLDNLIRNAVEAMPEGGDLSISAENTENGIVLKLTDTGEGIPEEDIPKIFKPFYTTKPGGMGLGLAYCKRTLEAHGGTITVESEEGKGSTFRITLPHLREG